MHSSLTRARADLGWLLLAAAAVRFWLFSGFVLGDDPAYATIASHVLTHGYPSVHGTDVIATRPILIALIAASTKALGWSERAVTLPFFVFSLLGIASCYCISAQLHNRRAAILGAALLALLPLDLIYATTITNDIVGTALTGCGVAVVLWGNAMRCRGDRLALLVCAAGGALAGFATGVKLSFVAHALPLVLTVLWLAWQRKPALTPAVAALAGWLAAQGAIAMFFQVTSHDWLANYHVEFAFNRAFMIEPYARSRAAALLTYPRWALLVQPVGPINDLFFPYGLFFPLTIGCVVLGLTRRTPGVALLAVWAVAVFAVLELAPVQLLPHYVPIHRLPRFLHAVALPGAALSGIVLADLSVYSARAAALSLALLTTYAVTSLDGSLNAWKRHHDAMIDLRASADIARTFPGQIVGDNELLDYLRFRDGYLHPDRFVDMQGATELTGTRLVFLGGGRRVDLDPMFGRDHTPKVVPASWMKLADMPGLVSPWRVVRGSVYVAGIEVISDSQAGVESTSSACPSGRQWQFRDAVDVGDERAELAHQYAIEKQTWHGQRTMRDRGRDGVPENGRAFVGEQRFVVSGLTPGVDACVVVTIDAGVRRQISRWFVDGRAATVTDTGTLAADGWWRRKSFVIPGAQVEHAQTELREAFESSSLDVNAFRIDVWQGLARNGRPRDRPEPSQR